MTRFEVSKRIPGGNRWDLPAVSFDSGKIPYSLVDLENDATPRTNSTLIDEDMSLVEGEDDELPSLCFGRIQQAVWIYETTELFQPPPGL